MQRAIDISLLGLDKVEEFDDRFEIGAVVSIRELEKSTILNEYYNDGFKIALEQIFGVQFRNVATLGGSVSQRMGFSDVYCLLLSLNANGGWYRDLSMA